MLFRPLVASSRTVGTLGIVGPVLLAACSLSSGATAMSADASPAPAATTPLVGVADRDAALTRCAEWVRSWRADGRPVIARIEVIAREGDAIGAAEPIEAWVDPAGRFGVRGFEVRVPERDGLLLTHATNDGAYVLVDGVRPLVGLTEVFGRLPLPHLAVAFDEQLRSGDETVAVRAEGEAFERALATFLPLANARFEAKGSREIDGAAFEIVSFTGADGRGELRFAADGSLATLEIERSGARVAPPGGSLVQRVVFEELAPDAFDPRVGDGAPIALERRRRVDAAQVLPRAPARLAAVGEPAPELVLDLVDGGLFDLSTRRGRVVVLDFWASWCGPCKRALPVLDAMAKRLAGEGRAVEVMTVNTSERSSAPLERRELARETFEELGVTLPIALDLDGRAASMWGVNGIPHTVIVGADGRLVDVVRGAGDAAERAIESAIESALEQQAIAPTRTPNG